MTIAVLQLKAALHKVCKQLDDLDADYEMSFERGNHDEWQKDYKRLRQESDELCRQLDALDKDWRAGNDY